MSVIYGCPLYRVSVIYSVRYIGCPLYRVSVIYGCPLYTGVRYIRVSVIYVCPLFRVSVIHGCPLYTGVCYIRVSVM